MQPEQSKLRMIEKPADCTNFEKVVCGKYNRFILTKSGELFCQGLNKDSCVGKDGLQIDQDKLLKGFIPVTGNFGLEPDDRIIDVSSGRNFTLIATSHGKVYGAG